MDVVWLLIGLTLLLVGGEVLVRGAVAIADRLGIPPTSSRTSPINNQTTSIQCAPRLARSPVHGGFLSAYHFRDTPPCAAGRVVRQFVGRIEAPIRDLE